MLVVRGALQVRGVEGTPVHFEDLVIEVAEKCERVHLETVELHRCAIRTAKEKPATARVHIEEGILSETPLELRLVKGEVTLLNSSLVGSVALTAVKADPDQKNPPPVRLLVNMCNVNRDFVIEKFKHVVIRGNGLHGQTCAFRDCVELTFDANVVKCPGVLIEQSAAGKLKKTKISKSDFHGAVLTLKAPRDGKKKDKVPVDKCWFNGRTKKKEIVGRDIRDGTVDEQSGAYVVMRKINKRPLGLGGMSTDAGR